MSAEARKTKCRCIARVNKILAESNTRLATCLTFRTSTLNQKNVKFGTALIIGTVRADSSKRNKRPMPAVTAKFCPFCGERMP